VPTAAAPAGRFAPEWAAPEVQAAVRRNSERQTDAAIFRSQGLLKRTQMAAHCVRFPAVTGRCSWVAQCSIILTKP
jgi:hypothetical protein